jgi:Uma2 family endonuclease
MNTIDREERVGLPRLVEGQRLDRATFHDLYEAMPEGTRAELIGGVVSMASALGRRHGRYHINVAAWIANYLIHTPGIEAFDNASVFFEDHGEPQPDLAVRILPEYGGRTRDEGKYYANGPELIVEVADSTLSKDLGTKLADYERAGVPEYIVVGVEPPTVRRHLLRDGRLVEVGPGADGLDRSQVFPGLWLDPVALLSGDLRALRDVVDRGVATPEHPAFVARLAEVARGGRP